MVVFEVGLTGNLRSSRIGEKPDVPRTKRRKILRPRKHRRPFEMRSERLKRLINFRCWANGGTIEGVGLQGPGRL